MPESVENWWSRRQASKGRDEPYPIGTYRSEWERFPVLIRQYHPDLNAFVTLTQIPPAAEVYLLWECESGHRFVATPGEQRDRPGRSRRRSTWCPECTEQALNRAPRHPNPVRPVAAAAPAASEPSHSQQARPDQTRSASRGAVRSTRHRQRDGPGMTGGTAFVSPIAPRPASAAEARLRAAIGHRLDVDLTVNAVVVRRPFHHRLEVWPDIVIAELMIAIEYDTTGRTSTEHVGSREKSDRQKDRLLREVGWEVIRIRTSKLAPIGRFDVTASSVTGALVDRVLERAGEIRGDLIVAAYERAGKEAVPDVGLEPTRP